MRFNKLVSEDQHDGRRITPYTWIYRWENPNEFKMEKKNEEYIMLAENVLYMDIKRYEGHRFLQNIVESRPYIII